MNKEIILKVDDLAVAFHMYRKGFRKGNLEVIHELSLDIGEKERFWLWSAPAVPAKVCWQAPF